MAKLSAMNPLGYIIDRQYKDGVVIKNKLFKERLAKARNLYRKDLLAHYGCVNAIEFSEEGELLVSGGDDRRVLLWSVPEAIHDRGSPIAMQTNHISNIFCLAFDTTNSKIFSGGNDDQVIIHDVNTTNLVLKLPHRKPVYGMSINPQNDCLLATAGDDGRILLFDLRESPNADAVCLAKQKTGFHSVMFNPTNPRLLTTANSEEGIALWDSRKPKDILVHYDSSAGQVSGISACFNSDGTRVLALRRRLPPVLYATEKENAVCQFYHPQYYNSCTMKTCCFAGENDKYVLSGSDDFNLYMWRLPEDDEEWGISHIVLRDHRSIVNQVRYNKQNSLIASSGVEKMIKLWSTVPVGTWKGSLVKEGTDHSRLVYSHENYMYLVGHSGERISHDYSDHSTQEDAKMMAFFDSLIQREIEGWDSVSDNTFTTDSDSDTNEQHLASITKKMFFNSRTTVEDNIKKHKLNKIAQLIAKKRHRLAKMAHQKCFSSIMRHKLKEKNRKRKAYHKFKASKSHKSNGTLKKTHSKHHSTTEKETRKHKFVAENGRVRKYRTRQSIKDNMCDNSNTSSNIIDAPSTSTGITSSSNSVFRVIEQDSDEDIPPLNCNETNGEAEENFVNILPTPLNGTHDMYISVLEMTNGTSNGDVSQNTDYPTTSNRINRSCRITCNNNNNNSQGCFQGYPDLCGSSSNSQNVNLSSLHNPSYSVNNNNNGHNNSYTNNNNSYVNDSDTDSDYGEYSYVTPIKKRRTVSASDSGCATGPCSSTSPYPLRSSRNHQACSSSYNNNNHDRSSDDDINYEKKRVKKARINIRKQIGVDSDSN